MSDGPAVTGQLVRRVTFRRSDGAVFACSQSSAFALETRYALSGTRDPSNVLVAETSAEPVASPCSRGNRPLSTYALQPKNDTLVAVSADFSQILTPLEAPPAAPQKASMAGEWRWQMTTIDDAGVSRTESEVWDIELVGETLSGHYERSVTLRSSTPIACAAGATSISIADRYSISGWIRPAGAEISELAVETGEHPCTPSARRHLDVAKATLYRDHLVLSWRADRRQVLSRPL